MLAHPKSLVGHDAGEDFFYHTEARSSVSLYLTLQALTLSSSRCAMDR
jgi:hypothetical protein